MDIDPRRLPFLLSVAREGGIVAAADILMVSPRRSLSRSKNLRKKWASSSSGDVRAILTPASTIVAGPANASTPTSPALKAPEATSRPGDGHGHWGHS